MSIIKEIYRLLRKIVQSFFRNRRNSHMRQRLINRTPTIICDNCIAGVIYHDLGLPFLSPTINLYFLPDDYIKFLENLDYYLLCDLQDSGEYGVDEGRKFPIGTLGDIKIYFMHYTSFEEAAEKWKDRCQRIDMENLFIIMTQRDGNNCTYEHMVAFDKLKYRNKILFTNKKYLELPSSVYIKGFENKNGVGNLISFKQPSWLAVHQI